ncbi:MAG: hypothetical protein JSS81_02340 [Acidobacteria bacterium]|nr:hypothetical protein [Acidobacteriota bacterium]
MQKLYLPIFMVFLSLAATACFVTSQSMTTGGANQSPNGTTNPPAATKPPAEAAKEDSGAQAAPPAAQLRTVTDYYLALPDDLFALDDSGRTIRDRGALLKYRRSLIKVEDIQNGYLKLVGNWEGWGEVAIFKRSGGGYLVAASTVECGPVCNGVLKLQTYDGGQWSDVTDQYAPKINGKIILDGFGKNGGFNEELKSGDDLPYFYKLPREGRMLNVACNECDSDTGEGDFVVLTYEWNGDKFVRR